MIQTLKNDLLTVEIDTHGAELQSITANRTNYQYLWHGDKTFWGRRSPFTVSFPVSTVLLAAAFRLLCRYFRRAKAVSDDNDSII